MENIKQEDLVEAPTSEANKEDTKTDTVEDTVETPTQDPLKKELEKVRKTGRTEAEKASFSLIKNAQRARELGVDPAEILGIKTPIDSEDEDGDDKPVTRKELKEIVIANASKTALQLADEIQDETERELVKYQIGNVIIPSGNSQEDLRTARRIVNSMKNEQIAIELARKTPPKNHSNSSGGSVRTTEQEPELTAQELAFMKHPFNLSKESILKSRQG